MPRAVHDDAEPVTRPRAGRAGGVLAILVLAALLPGCGGRVEVVAAAKPPPRARPATGPWFVDRARDYGVDVVTPCGNPEKSSILDSIGTGVALLDFDGD